MLFWYCARNAQYLADGTFCGGPFWGLQSIKFLDASQFRLCLLFGNGVGKPEYRAPQRVPSALFYAKKDCSTWVLPSIAVLFVYSTLSVIAALCRFPLRPSCEKAAQPSPQAWLSCKIKMQFLELCAERSGAHLKSFCFGQKCSYSDFTCSSCSQ